MLTRSQERKEPVAISEDDTLDPAPALVPESGASPPLETLQSCLSRQSINDLNPPLPSEAPATSPSLDPSSPTTRAAPTSSPLAPCPSAPSSLPPPSPPSQQSPHLHSAPASPPRSPCSSEDDGSSTPAVSEPDPPRRVGAASSDSSQVQKENEEEEKRRLLREELMAAPEVYDQTEIDFDADMDARDVVAVDRLRVEPLRWKAYELVVSSKEWILEGDCGLEGEQRKDLVVDLYKLRGVLLYEAFIGVTFAGEVVDIEEGKGESKEMESRIERVARLGELGQRVWSALTTFSHSSILAETGSATSWSSSTFNSDSDSGASEQEGRVRTEQSTFREYIGKRDGWSDYVTQRRDMKRRKGLRFHGHARGASLIDIRKSWGQSHLEACQIFRRNLGDEDISFWRDLERFAGFDIRTWLQSLPHGLLSLQNGFLSTHEANTAFGELNLSVEVDLANVPALDHLPYPAKVIAHTYETAMWLKSLYHFTPTIRFEQWANLEHQHELNFPLASPRLFNFHTAACRAVHAKGNVGAYRRWMQEREDAEDAIQLEIEREYREEVEMERQRPGDFVPRNLGAERGGVLQWLARTSGTGLDD